MGSEIIKILRVIISTTKLSNYVFNGSGDRFSVLTTGDLLSDPEISQLVQSRTMRNFTNGLEIIAQASPKHAYNFLKIYEGRNTVRLLLEKSSFIRTGYDIETYLDETTELMSKMAENDPF